MKRVLWIPTSKSEEPEVINLDDRSEVLNTPFDTEDPYKLFRQLMQVKVGEDVWGEKVRVMGLDDYGLMVDDSGLLLGRKTNEWASYVLYPGVLAGDVLLFKFEWQYNEDGPYENVVDYDWTDMISALAGRAASRDGS